MQWECFYVSSYKSTVPIKRIHTILICTETIYQWKAMRKWKELNQGGTSISLITEHHQKQNVWHDAEMH